MQGHLNELLRANKFKVIHGVKLWSEVIHPFPDWIEFIHGVKVFIFSLIFLLMPFRSSGVKLFILSLIVLLMLFLSSMFARYFVPCYVY